MRKNIIKIYAAILSCGFLYYILIQYCGISIPCFYNKYFGIQCAGCGLTRMCKAIIRFDFYEGFMYNPVAFILLIVWNFIALLLFIGKPTFVKNSNFLWTVFIISMVILIVFGIVRNFY